MIWSSEQIFLRVVEAGSLKAAAEQIGLDPSAVSRKLAALEARLGVKLLERSTRRTVPSDAGRRYYEGMRRLIDEQTALEARVAEFAEKPAGRLRVTAPVDFGARFVTPVISALRQEAPDLAIELHLGSHFFDLTEQGIDVAIRIGQLDTRGMSARRVGAVPRVLVASAAYLDQHAPIERPEDLASHPFVLYRAGQTSLTLRMAHRGQPRSIVVSGELSANSVSSVRELVLRGHGLHMGPVWAFQDEIKRGRLRAVLPAYTLPSFPLHAVHAPSHYLPAKISSFIDRLAASVAAEPALETE